MTWVYLNLTRFCVSVPHTVCIEKNNNKRKQKRPTYQPQSFWACNPKHTHLNLDFDLDLDWFYDISGLDLKKKRLDSDWLYYNQAGMLPEKSENLLELSLN